MQKPLAVFAFSVALGLGIVFGCSAPSPDGSNLSGGKKSSSSSGSSGDAAPSTSTSGSVTCTNHEKVSDRPACDTCTKAKCCAEIVACDNASDCLALEKCFAACAPDDDTCGFVCISSHDKGTGLLQDVQSCASGKCASDCPAPVQDAGSSGDPFDTDI